MTLCKINVLFTVLCQLSRPISISTKVFSILQKHRAGVQAHASVKTFFVAKLEQWSTVPECASRSITLSRGECDYFSPTFCMQFLHVNYLMLLFLLCLGNGNFENPQGSFSIENLLP